MARKTQRRPDKIELGVVDIHTHVLPGIDDGAEKMALSYRMLRRSYGSSAIIRYYCYIPCTSTLLQATACHIFHTLYVLSFLICY